MGGGAREGSKIIFEMDGISALARPSSLLPSFPPSPSPPSLSRPQSMKVQMGGNDVALFTFFHTRATTRRDETRIRSLARSESPQGRRRDGGRFSSLPFSFTPLLVTDPKKFSDPYSTQKVLLFLKVYLYSTGAGEETGAPPKRVPVHETLKSFVPRLIKGANDCEFVSNPKNKKLFLLPFFRKKFRGKQ